MAKSTTIKTNADKPKAKTATNKLVIVESPAKAKTITKFLGKGYRVVASNGHIRDLPKSQLGVDTENNFNPKYITLRGRGDVLDRIRKEAKNANRIYLATDPDREGEAISWHLAQILKLDETSPCRIEFNEITPTAIKNAIKIPRAIDMDLVDAQQARRILDRLVGYKISPILWSKVRKGLSAGRVQSVATRIIVDREEEIRAFLSQEYWTITAQLIEPRSKRAFDANFIGKQGKKIEVNNEADALSIVKSVEISLFTATNVKTGKKSKSSAPPFTTSNLQQEASRKLGFTTKRTMIIAQQLYEGVDVGTTGSVGLVSYIRTDSVRVSSDALTIVRSMITEHYGAQYVPEKPNYYKGRKDAQDAHEAIRPTNIDMTPDFIKQFITLDQYKLYKLIYDRFVASQMCPAQYATVAVDIVASDYDFKATGSQLLFDGFTRVYTEGRDEGKYEKETMLPNMEAGDVFKPKKVTPDQHFTQPPLRYTEASLVKALEEKGIGRPSTYAPTISTIIDRGYVRREKKNLYPTELGEVVTKLMKENFENIVDVKFTANMENELDEVEEGAKDYRTLLREFYGPFEKTLEIAASTIERVNIPDEISDVVCDKCGSLMVYKMGRFGRFLACPKYPECKNTKPIVETIETPCPKCGAKLIKRKTKKGGKIFYGCEKYPECDYISWDMPAKERCPKCGEIMVYKTGKYGKEIRCTNKDCAHVIRPEKKNTGEESDQHEE